jgi:superfamily II DNA or RNA helicase
MSISDSIMNGARTAYLDRSIYSLEYLRPRLILNNHGMKVLNYLKDELHHCDEFYFSVAFITMSGITPLLQDLLELERRGVKGKILTTDYLNFTEPEALEKLLEFSNIEVRFFYQEREGFHTKGYFFKSGDVYTGIIGSSNLTLKALTVNNEWNLGFSSLYDGELLQDVLGQFEELWSKSSNVYDILQEYKSTYNSTGRHLPRSIENCTRTSFKPNSMQREFISNLHKLLDKGEKRALLVSATGTGKTYASAFAVKDANPRKFLFVVHREQIAKQAIESYKRVFKGDEDKFGLLTGNCHDFDKDYLFATVQTMSKDHIYTRYSRDEFDYIVIDEVHKAGADSYQKLFEYFTPKFYLGMSASPDRTDDFNIYELFDYNVPLDIRLEDALEEDLLCPFQYFGITDLEVNGKTLTDESEFRYLTSDDRVNYILEKSDFYGYSGSRRKALVFCSTKKEARELAKKFNEKEHPTIALTGEDKQEVREDAIDRLTNDEREDRLEYIITVDIFNEGVDIPEVNQVLLVRPTQSSIIFIQQLGRGLRKTKDKEYVVVIDFIGNYKNNFLIPIALSGDTSYDKDATRRYLMEANKQIIGSSTINFDEISRKRIYESINNASFSNIKLFKEKYQSLKYKLNRIPYLVDFYKNKELDPIVILNHNKFGCYHDFLIAYDNEYKEVMTKDEIKSLKFITDHFADGKRPHELIILQLLTDNGYFTIRQVEEKLQEYGITDDIESIKHSFRMFNQSFLKKNDQKKYEGVIYFNCTDNIDSIPEHDSTYYNITEEFNSHLQSDTYKKHLKDLIDYALLRYTDKYCPQTENINLKLYEKYSRKDVCRLLNWPGNDSATMYGYRIKYDTLPMFVTYKKEDNISDSTKYQDEFISREIFSWMTRNNVKLDSKEPQQIINNEKLEKHLFIKKSDDEGSEFYYIGQVDVIDYNETKITNDKGNELPVVNFKYKLHYPVKEELYNYLVNDID